MTASLSNQGLSFYYSICTTLDEFLEIFLVCMCQLESSVHFMNFMHLERQEIGNWIKLQVN